MKQKYREGAFTKFLTQKAAKLRVPISSAFELTPLCNMKCKMCYVTLSKQECDKIGRHRTIEESLDIAHQAKVRGMLYLLLTGGEPFVYKDFKRLYLELFKMGFIISINSNATLIDEETVKWLKEYPPQRINITLYGSSNEVYGNLCNNPKGFNQVTKAINLLKEANINIKLNYTLTPYNSDDLEFAYKFAEDNDLILQASTYMFPPVRKDKSKIGQNERYSPEEAAKFYVKSDLLLYTKEKFKKRAEMMKDGLLKINCSDLNFDCEVDKGQKINCQAGKSLFWITWDGRMLPCGMMNTPVAYPFRDGFDNAWKQIVNEVEELYLPKECENCKIRSACSSCGAIAYTETGRTDGKPEYMCKMTESIIEQTQLKYEELKNIK